MYLFIGIVMYSNSYCSGYTKRWSATIFFFIFRDFVVGAAVFNVLFSLHKTHHCLSRLHFMLVGFTSSFSVYLWYIFLWLFFSFSPSFNSTVLYSHIVFTRSIPILTHQQNFLCIKYAHPFAKIVNDHLQIWIIYNICIKRGTFNFR